MSAYELVRPPAWMEQALCTQTDPEAFFPERGCSARPALATCHGCPVEAECLAHAIANDERDGVWGGVTERHRRAMKPHGQVAS